jgi:O-antigen/teichoic acid export membrane protein
LVNYRFDVFLVSYFLGATQTGLYTAAVSIAEMAWLLPKAIANILFPTISSLESEKANDLTTRANRIQLWLMGVVFIIFSPLLFIIIPFVLGQEFAASALTCMLLLPGILGFSIVRVLYSDVSGRGKPELGTLSVAFSVLLTLILDLFLIPRYGINGAAVASSLAYLASSILITNFFRRLSGVSTKEILIINRSDLIFIREALIEFQTKYYQKIANNS